MGINNYLVLFYVFIVLVPINIHHHQRFYKFTFCVGNFRSINRPIQRVGKVRFAGQIWPAEALNVDFPQFVELFIRITYVLSLLCCLIRLNLNLFHLHLQQKFPHVCIKRLIVIIKRFFAENLGDKVPLKWSSIFSGHFNYLLTFTNTEWFKVLEATFGLQ